MARAAWGTASNREKQMTSDACCLVRPGASPEGAQLKRPHTSIAKLRENITMHRKMRRSDSAMEQPAPGMFLERPEPCEGKLSVRREVVQVIVRYGRIRKENLRFRPQ
jgi:hypothetical protein